MQRITVTQHPLFNSTDNVNNLKRFRPVQRKIPNTQFFNIQPRLFFSLKTGTKRGTHKAKVLDLDYDDEDDEVSVAFPSMKEWLENKPKGFGEGKVYDTEIEDKLVEEIQRSSNGISRAGDAKLKDIGLKKDDKMNMKAPEAVQSGVPVRLLNLPKKKNVHRDLKSAFVDVPGVISISPAVSGNKKTRDPICKGFGFIYFKTDEHALRFVQMFSGQSITYGKVQKQIKCEMVNSRSSKSFHLQSADLPANSQSVDSISEENLQYDSDINEYSMASGEETADESDELSDEALTSELEDINKDFEYISEIKVNSSNDMEPLMDSETDSLASKHKTKTKGNKKNPVAKQKKPQNLVIPGSAKRLKVKEKSVLTGVLSKYGAKPAAKG